MNSDPSDTNNLEVATAQLVALLKMGAADVGQLLHLLLRLYPDGSMNKHNRLKVNT